MAILITSRPGWSVNPGENKVGHGRNKFKAKHNRENGGKRFDMDKIIKPPFILISEKNLPLELIHSPPIHTARTFVKSSIKKQFQK